MTFSHYYSFAVAAKYSKDSVLYAHTTIHACCVLQQETITAVLCADSQINW
jgi:hypothetical protein